MSYWDIINPLSWPGHFVGGLGRVGSALTSDTPAREGGIYGGPVGHIGVPGYDDRAERLLEAQSGLSGSRGMQMEQANRLLQMSKEGDPLARARLQEQAEQNAARANAQALTMGPGNAALGARMAMQQGSLARRDASGKAAMADTAARLGATQQLTGLLQGMRQQDLGYAGLELQQGLGQGQLNLGRENVLANRYGSTLKVPTEGEQYRAMLSQGVGFVGGLLSDKRAKTDVADGDDAADEFMDKLAPKTYRYKEGDARKLLGIMAQDVEQSAAGKSMVKETDRGKVLDAGALMSGLAASVVRLNNRLRKLEDK